MKKVKTFIKRKIAGECVLIPTGDTSREFNGFLNMNETAELIWDHLEEVDSLDQLADLIVDEYEVDPETAKQDAAEMLVKFLNSGVIVLTDPAKNW